MENLDQLHAALIKADAAGDTASAKILADHIRAVSAQSAAPAAKAEPSLAAQAWDGTKNFGLGLVKGVLAPVDGAAQLVTNGMATAAHAVAPGSAADKWAKNYANEVNNINTDRENKYQAMTPGSIAAGVGNVIGQVAVPLKGTQVASKGATLGAKLAGGLTTGAVVGAAQPVYGAGDNSLTDVIKGATAPRADYWDEKAKQIGLGAALGGGLSGLAAAGGSVVNALRPAFAPGQAVGDQLVAGLAKSKGKALAEVAPNDPNLPGLLDKHDPRKVLARLLDAKPLVEGSLPTTAQVAGIPQLVMAEKVLRTNPASAEDFIQRGINNNSARMQAVRGVAQTPQALEAAVQARSQASSPLYDAFGRESLPLDDSLTGLLNTPIGKDAIGRARALAANKQRPFGLEPATPSQTVPSSFVGADGMPLSSTTIPGAPGSISGEAANQIKMSIDAMKRDTPVAGVASHEAGALNDIRGQLLDQLDAKSPTFQQARQEWAQGSVPVNTMEAGQSVMTGLEGLGHNTEGEVAPMLSQYRTKLADALKKAKYGIDPDAQKTLESVQQDLQRESISNSIRQPGSDSVFNMQAPNWLAGKLFGDSLNGQGIVPQGIGALGGFLTGGPMGAYGGKIAAEKGGQFVGNRVNGEFQKAMLDPQYFAKLLGEALDRQTASPSTLQQFAPVGARGATVGAETIMSPSP